MLDIDIKITPKNQLPTIITKTGKYRMRNGGIAEIDTIVPQGDLSTTLHNCKGYILRETPTGRIKRDFTIWHESGFFAVKDHQFDIIGLIKEDEAL